MNFETRNVETRRVQAEHQPYLQTTKTFSLSVSIRLQLEAIVVSSRNCSKHYTEGLHSSFTPVVR